VIIESGNIDLFVKFISNPSLVKDRIIFIKNIETINVPIFEFVAKYPFIVSRDFQIYREKNKFKNFEYNTEILFNTMENKEIPLLKKYQAFMKDKLGNQIVGVY
jgi:hypothetical protein